MEARENFQPDEKKQEENEEVPPEIQEEVKKMIAQGKEPIEIRNLILTWKKQQREKGES